MQEPGIRHSLFEAAVVLHASLEPGEVIQRALNALNRLLRAEAWAVFLKDVHADHLELVRAINAAAVPAAPFVDLSDHGSPVAEAARECRMVANDGGLANHAAPESAVVAVPLAAGSRFIGV